MTAERNLSPESFTPLDSVMRERVELAAEQLNITSEELAAQGTSYGGIASITQELGGLYKENYEMFGGKGEKVSEEVLRGDFGFCEAGNVAEGRAVILTWIGGSGKDRVMSVDLAVRSPEAEQEESEIPSSGTNNGKLLFNHFPLAQVDGEGNIQLPDSTPGPFRVSPSWLIARELVDRNEHNVS